MIYFPEDKLTIIILANLVTVGFVPQSLGFCIMELVYNKSVISPSERKEIVCSPELLTKFVGSYTLTPVDIYYTNQTSNLVISLENDHLIAQLKDNSKIKLFSESETKFFSIIPDVQIEFLKDEQDKIKHLIFQQDRDRFTGVIRSCS